ncbi:MAG: MmgE/PrpD family protein [Chloroflexi bacterium]|nr:MmgE/PrpD family protein [Chloroflexota bacterium]
MGATEQLATFLVQIRFEDIPQQAVDATKKFFLDCLGTALAGSWEEVGKIVTEYTRAAGGKPESRLVGSGVFTSAANAAFANGTMTKGSHSGNAARVGVTAALLVQKGYQASQEIIEGGHCITLSSARGTTTCYCAERAALPAAKIERSIELVGTWRTWKT